MPSNEVMESKKLEVSSAIAIAALTGALTLAGVMSTSLVGWISSNQTAKLSERAAKLAERQACVTRIDLQEQNLRAKADIFLSALGSYLAIDGHKIPKDEVKDSRLDELLKAGYAFSAYAPSGVSETTQKMVVRLKNSAAQTDAAKINEYNNAVFESYKQWNLDFQESLKASDISRSKCSL
ncbi:hypothetical protein OKW98_16550 [Pseudomonas sp. KU26590]|uniref:hypothetical protein n=1 Tax=Pseudomonas sp. KU26590 TaxID=2991051 RepID=UPI00223CCCA4|nr:hypothetical protein [Pseudomonas sp. KU26590]UZJ58212.1 hypothetical protein OKW98_16550 [Pseudomonas sp. KU26590]